MYVQRERVCGFDSTKNCSKFSVSLAKTSVFCCVFFQSFAPKTKLKPSSTANVRCRTHTNLSIVFPSKRPRHNSSLNHNLSPVAPKKFTTRAPNAVGTADDDDANACQCWCYRRHRHRCRLPLTQIRLLLSLASSCSGALS